MKYFKKYFRKFFFYSKYNGYWFVFKRSIYNVVNEYSMDNREKLISKLFYRFLIIWKNLNK